ncbi:MAG TPA: SIMPL domain-containing protein [Candidatus Pacearchaeota archaeon]|nr:SIMPL domain-containing protein [Candidatus Pacearchaeota archaeon]
MGKNNAIIITSIIAGVILIIALLALNTFNSIVPSSGKTVTVEGVATIKALPDVTSVYFTIETKGATSVEAKDANNVIYDNLIEEMLSVGFEENDVKTESYNIYENTYWEDSYRKQVTDGYKATRYLKIELSSEESDKLSDVIDAGVDAGAGISYINFELSQESQNKYKAEALKLASKDATIKADAIASGFNKEAGRLVSVQISDFGYYPWNVYSAKSEGGMTSEDSIAAQEAATSIQPSDQDITASVTATFKLR